MSTSPSRRELLGGAGLALLAGALPPACAAAGADGGASDAGAGPGAGSGSGADAGATAGGAASAETDDGALERPAAGHDGPLIVSTWGFGQQANAAAWEALRAGVAHPFEAAEAGVRVIEADPGNASVGYGGNPNAEGVVELDACVMRGDTLACGGVAALQDTLHPVSVARAVMEQTIHVLLVGDGARSFAASQGFEAQDMLTERSRAAYARWLREGGRPPPEEDHDTIGQIVFDQGRFGIAVTTSGRAWKLPGRVGDSPLVGAGAYCDDRAGACVSTGVGEEAIRVCGSFAVVEAMRRGASAAEACHEITARVADNGKRDGERHSVAFLAVDRAGGVAGACTTEHFRFAYTDAAGTRMFGSEVVW